MRLPRPLPRSRVVWPSLIGGLALLDWFCDQGEPDGDTLTELVRDIYRPQTVPGKVALGASIVGGGVVLFIHFCKVV